MKEGRR